MILDLNDQLKKIVLIIFIIQSTSYYSQKSSISLFSGLPYYSIKDYSNVNFSNNFNYLVGLNFQKFFNKNCVEFGIRYQTKNYTKKYDEVDLILKEEYNIRSFYFNFHYSYFVDLNQNQK